MENQQLIRAYIDGIYANIANYPPGLWNGKMGIAVLFYHYARCFGDKDVEKMGEHIIDNIFSHINPDMPRNFAHGLTGIGAGIEYLVQNNFMEGDTDDALQDIDSLMNGIIHFRNLSSISIESGVGGFLFYHYMRLKGKALHDESRPVLENRMRLVLLIDWLESMMDSATNQDLYDIYLLLVNVRTLDVINFKVDKLLSYCLHRIDFSQPLYDNFHHLGITQLNLLKPWI